MYSSNERAMEWKHCQTLKLLRQWFVCGLHILILWALAIPVIASNKVSQPEQDYLELPLSIDDIRHLLMRTGIGARPADILEMQGLSRQQAIGKRSFQTVLDIQLQV